MIIATVATRFVAAMAVAAMFLAMQSAVPLKVVPWDARAKLAAFALSAVAVATAC
jgi:hypothetical protein